MMEKRGETELYKPKRITKIPKTELGDQKISRSLKTECEGKEHIAFNILMLHLHVKRQMGEHKR